VAEQLSDVKEIPCTAAKIENAFRPRQVELDLADPADVNINPSFEIEKFGPVQAGTFDTVTLANLPETLSIDRFDDSLRFQRKAVRPKESERVPSCAGYAFAIYKLLKFMGKFLETMAQSHWRIDHSLWRSATISTKLQIR